MAYNETTKKYRQTKKYKEYYAQWVKTHREEKRQVILQHYGPFCACCNETGDSFLTIDHVNNDGYADPQTGLGLYNRIIREGFPDRYQILCMNCNHSKRMNKGFCEHTVVK